MKNITGGIVVEVYKKIIEDTVIYPKLVKTPLADRIKVTILAGLFIAMLVIIGRWL